MKSALTYLLLFFLSVGAKGAFAVSTQDIYDTSKESVVLIIAYDKDGIPLGLGSGFFVSECKIVTNYHVLKDAARIVAKNSIASIKTEVKRIDSYSKYLDLAVLKVKHTGKPLPISQDSQHNVGDKVIAIGNPRGLEGTVSEGIISAKRNVDNFVIYQITAPISPGSSGGPLFNDKGKVFGVTTATISEGQNLNFAMPITLLSRLKKGGKWEPSKTELPCEAKRGNAGMSLSDVAKQNPYSTKISFSLRNKNSYAVKNIVYLLLYRNVRTGQMVHFSLFTNRDLIPSGLAKRIIQQDTNLKGLTTDRRRMFADGIINAELRVLSYDIEEQNKHDALTEALKKLK